MLIVILSTGITLYVMSLLYPHEDFWDWKRKEPRWPLKGWLNVVAIYFLSQLVLGFISSVLRYGGLPPTF